MTDSKNKFKLFERTFKIFETSSYLCCIRNQKQLLTLIRKEIMKASANTKFEILGSKGQVIAIFKVKEEVKVKRGRKASVKEDKIVEVLDARQKWDLGKPVEKLSEIHNAIINLTKKEITIFGTVKRTEWKSFINGSGQIEKGYVTYNADYSKTFKVGDTIKTGSYNLIYTNPITNIAAASVFADGKRFSIADFARYNWNLDLEAIANHNANERYYI